ncbi:uncharacterized protein ARMOST_08286 [Armillaria ostoyae]|uniref:Uncharacterized protein n=1 Tax=Armillaria ostoyae TaxID=47428 RepID=A0A284R891_ARMOS|nr:uncharacterized protein ARMOST_08286 [Armillaria ostoyae]
MATTINKFFDLRSNIRSKPSLTSSSILELYRRSPLPLGSTQDNCRLWSNRFHCWPAACPPWVSPSLVQPFPQSAGCAAASISSRAPFAAAPIFAAVSNAPFLACVSSPVHTTTSAAQVRESVHPPSARRAIQETHQDPCARNHPWVQCRALGGLLDVLIANPPRSRYHAVGPMLYSLWARIQPHRTSVRRAHHHRPPRFRVDIDTSDLLQHASIYFQTSLEKMYLHDPRHGVKVVEHGTMHSYDMQSVPHKTNGTEYKAEGFTKASRACLFVPTPSEPCAMAKTR